MKKFLLSTFALLGMSAVVSAQDNLIVNDVYAMPGQTVVATLNFSSPENVYKGMHIYLTFPEGFTMEASGAVSSDRDGDFLKYVVDGKEANFAIGNDQTFTTTSVNVEFTVGEGVAVSDKPYEIAVSGQFEASGVEDGPVSGKINVIVTDVLTLDENSQVAPEDADPCKVKVLRTLKANEWSTICLPFDVEDIEEVFGEDVQLATLSGCTFTEEGGVVKNIDLAFTTANAIEANKPYIIKVSNDMSEFTLEEAEIYKGTPSTRVGKSGARAYMYGTYAATVVPEDNAFISNNKFWYSAGKTIIKGYRCYFKFDKNLPDTADSRFSMSIDGEQTGIVIPELMPMDGEYYNLNGLRVETPSKGIYIKDGKKVVVK
jgi:hypothetical protein